MEKAFAKVEELAGTLKEYVNTCIESVKLNTAEKVSNVIGNLIARVLVTVVFLFFIGFASVGLAFFISEWIGKTWAGFLIVAGLYLLIGIIVWAARGRIISLRVMNALIKQLFSSDEED